ncbi:hypothetical protein [Robiginitomaculum antarcticum]|uniref:hypothetical protein n=1 Tax=Robiginitomaculum antarcticum TaxID=437507 RepID=UPI00035E2DB5|nr:hypothetical protein [Robiginitomaculum antarcticum]
MSKDLICTRGLVATIHAMLTALGALPMGRELFKLSDDLRRAARKLSRLERLNAVIRRKAQILASPQWRGRVMCRLGGERTLSAWERRKASEAARIGASHRKPKPLWWIEQHQAKLRAKALRTAGWARPCDEHPLIYAGTPDYALEPIKRGPSVLRGCSLARREARPPHRLDALPTIYFIPSELRGGGDVVAPAPTTPQYAAPSPRTRAPLKARPAAQAVPQDWRSGWEDISRQTAIDEIFGGEKRARASP